MLQAAHHDSWGNSNVLGKLRDVLFASEVGGANTLLEFFWGDQEIRCKGIGLLFLFGRALGIILEINKGGFTVKENMASFVEETKSEMVIGFMAQTKLQDSLARS